jgi:amino acid adenylation domain-containing protein
VISAVGDSAHPDRAGVHDLVARWVERRPSATAVRDSLSGASLTYGELWERAGWLAGELARRGVLPGDLVAVGMDPSLDLVTAFLGILLAGAVYVPLDPHAPAERLALTLSGARCDVVVVGSGQEWARRWAGRLPTGLPWLAVPLTEPAGSGVPDVRAGGHTPAYVSFTSGSTGRPKGVVVPHRAVHRLVVGPNYCSIGPDDRVANLSNPAFDATTFELWSTLTAGATVVVFPAVTDLPLDDWIARLADDGITTMFLTTSLFHTIARERPGAFRSVRELLIGGEQLDIGAVRRVLAAEPPIRLVNAYGPTEATTFAATFECTADSLAEAERVPIGFALQNTTLLVLDDRLAPVAPGEVGELCIGGPGVALGYLGQPALTSEKFVLEPGAGHRVYRTGDLVRRLDSGALEVVGRRDRQVKVRGFRIELEEIEEAAVATGLVESAFVEKVGDGPGATLVGFVLANGTGEVSGELRRRLGARLPAYMLPSRWIVLPKVPLGPTGKADRARMLALLEAGAGEKETIVMDAVGRIWAMVLGVPHVSPRDNFLDLGGNSVLAVQAASRISQHLAVRVEPGDIMLAETLGEFGESLRSAEVATS